MEGCVAAFLRRHHTWTLGPWAPRDTGWKVSRNMNSMNQWLKLVKHVEKCWRKHTKAMVKPYQASLLQAYRRPSVETSVDFEMPTAWCRGHEGHGHAASAEEREDHVIWERLSGDTPGRVYESISLGIHILDKGTEHRTYQFVLRWSKMIIDDL